MPGPEARAKGEGTRIRARGTRRPAGTPGNPITLSEDELNVLENMAKIGMSETDMATILGFSRSTFDRLCRDDPLISDALELGRSKGILKAHTWAFKRAFEEGDPNMARFWLQCRGKMNPPPKEHVVRGDASAPPPLIAFALKGAGSGEAPGLPDLLAKWVDKPQRGETDEE